MSNFSQAVYLRNIVATQPVKAELRQPISDADLLDWQQTWIPEVANVVQKLRAQGMPRANWPQSWHWNWAAKVHSIQGLLGQDTFSLRAEGRLQGLMQLNLTKSSRIENQKGKPLVYVEYLETAPWNRPSPFQGPLLSGVGSVFVATAINRSIEEEFKGRVGLHALPQSENFYRDKCGMTDLGNDPNYQNLRYFETTPEQAVAFLGGGGSQ
jgi:hypothetical protein